MLRRATDDDILRADKRWRGPPGMTLPVSLSYKAMPVGAVAFFGCLLFLSIVGVSGLWRIICAFAAAGAGYWIADRFSSSERPISALPAVVVHETSAPRAVPGVTESAVLRPAQLPVRPLPRPRKGDR